MKSLLDLPEEILVEILRVSEVEDVLRLERVSVQAGPTLFLISQSFTASLYRRALLSKIS